MTNQTKQEVLYLKKEIIYLEINKFENSNTSKSNEVLQINKLKEEVTLPEPDVTKLVQTPVVQTTPLENMCVLQNRIQYGKRRRILNKILSESYIKRNKNLCTCKVQVQKKHKLSHNVLLRRLRILSDSKRNNKLFYEHIENVKVLTFIDISSDDLSDKETIENVKGKKKKNTNYTQTSQTYTAVTKSSDGCRTFCEEILPTTYVLSNEETVDNVRRKKGKNTHYIRTSKPYTYSKDSRKKRKNANNYIQTSDTVIQISKPFTLLTNSSDDYRTVRFCEEILPTTHHVLSDEETVDNVIQTSEPFTAVSNSNDDCRTITFCEEILPTTHHVLSDEETVDNVIQISEPFTAVTNSNDDYRTVTFCDEILPTTHHVLLGAETVDNVTQTSKTYTAVTESSEDCGTLTFCDEKFPTPRLKIQDFENKKFRKLLQYMYEKVDLKIIETMSVKEFNVIVIIENENLKLTDIFITDKKNIITEIATVPINDYSYIFNLYDKSDDSNNSKKLCCNILRLQCCCWHNRQKQIELKFPKDFKRFLFIPHSCLNSCSCCCNENGKEFVSEKPKQTNNLSATDITTTTQSFLSTLIPQNTLQAKASMFKKPKYKQTPDSLTKSVQSYSSLSLQFYFETKLKELTGSYKQLVETIEFGNKGDILFHDYNVETNSMCLVRLDIKYVILTQSIITDNICCKYKYDVVLEKLRLVFKIDPNILTYIRSGHKNTLSIHLDICKDCKLNNIQQSMDFTKNPQFKLYGRKVNLPIEHSRKAIVSRAVKPKLVAGEQTKHQEQPKTLIVTGEQSDHQEQTETLIVTGEQSDHQEQMETLIDVPINIILKTVPKGTLFFQVNPNDTVNFILPVQGESSKAIQNKKSQKMERLNYLETAFSYSILQNSLENKSQDEILLPKITDVYSLKESNVKEEIDNQVDAKSQIDIEDPV